MSWFRKKQPDHTEVKEARRSAEKDLAATRKKWRDVERIYKSPDVTDLFAAQIFEMIQKGDKHD